MNWTVERREKAPGIRAPLLILLILICSIGLSGCGSARRGEPLVGPLPITSAAVAHGQQVFMLQCQPCHPGGEAGLGPALNDKPLPAFLIRLQVRSGFGAMPSFATHEIAKDELHDLIAYLKALRRHGRGAAMAARP